MSQSLKIMLLAGLALAAIGFGCRSSQPGLAVPSHRASRTTLSADQSGAPILPDPKMTPGATLPVATGDICVSGYSKKVRNVPADVKQQAYAEYGITSHQSGEYEIDHLISLELGGSNSIKNLWPQSYVTQPWNAHVKDKLENELHAEVCAGKIDLPTAQHEIATDWIASYKKHFNTSLPLSSARAPLSSARAPLSSARAPLSSARAPLSSARAPLSSARAPLSVGGSRRVRHPLTGNNNPFGTSTPPGGAAPANGQVWVNLKSGKYFQPGSSYYGHTKSGQYLSEAAAQQQGYVAAKGQ